MSEKAIKGISVTAQTVYNGQKIPINVNSEIPLKLETDDFDIYVLVRIKGYANESASHEKTSSESNYFDSEEHKRDSFSVQFVVTFKKDVTGDQLKWGNDWDKPIRDILPWGFSAAFSAFKYAVDPGVDGDVYADKPWIYGAALSSINYMEKLDKNTDPESVRGPIEEKDASARHKKYLDKEELKKFTFRKGESYAFDFANPYLEMSSTPKIKMPGFTFDVGKYAGMTELRYVLKCDEQLVFALVFEAQPE